MLHSDPLLVSVALVHSLAAQVHQLRLADPALARRVRGAGVAIAQSLASAQLAPTTGHAARHRQRARAQAVALIEHLQVASQRDYFLPHLRRESTTLASHLIALLDAAT